jgi:hypothetical protein
MAAMEMRTQEQQEQHLKQYSLRSVEVCDFNKLLVMEKIILRTTQNAFWSINNDLTDLHAAVSYDCLHSDDNGLWEDHFFRRFKEIGKILGHDSIVAIDAQ